MKQSVHCRPLRYLMPLFCWLMEALLTSWPRTDQKVFLAFTSAPPALSAAATGNLSAPGSASPTGEPDWVKAGSKAYER